MARFGVKRKKRLSVLTKIISGKRGNRLIIITPGLKRGR